MRTYWFVVAVLYAGLGWSADQQELLDWQPKESLSPEEQARCPVGCRGAYVDPQARLEKQLADKGDPSQADIVAEADEAELNTETRVASFRGNVIIDQGARRVESERIEIDQQAETLELEGDVVVREPGILLTGERARVSDADGRIQVDDAAYLFHEQRIRGTAALLERSEDETLSIEEATYTSCEPGDDAWVLHANSIRINQETGRAVARGVKLTTSDVPFFYFPYLNFIVDDRRASGILFPTLGVSNDEGFRYSQPVYFNISPNQDLTATPHFTTERGSGLELEHRFLTRRSFTRASGAFFPDDDVNLENPDNRYAIALQHQGRWGKLSTEVDFAQISDDDFFEDWRTDVVDVDRRDTFLRQRAGLAVSLDNWQLSLVAQDYQNIVDDDQEEYDEVPRFQANGHYRFGRGGFVRLNNEYTRFDHELDDALFAFSDQFQLGNDGTVVTGERIASTWHIGYQLDRQAGYFEARAGASLRSYQLDTPLAGQTDDNPDLLSPELSISAGLNFERQLSGGRLTQTLQPKLFYFYRDADDQDDIPFFDTVAASENYDQLFRDNTFIGGDRLDDANRISLGLESHFFSNDSGREIASLKVGQAFLLQQERSALGARSFTPETLALTAFLDPLPPLTATPITPVPAFGAAGPFFGPLPTIPLPTIIGPQPPRPDNRSLLIGEARWQVQPRWGLEADLFWNGAQSEIARAQFGLSYRNPDRDNHIRLSYRIEEDTGLLAGEFADFVESIEQVAVEGQWHFYDRWSIVFRAEQDLENSRRFDRLAGIQYESCCWNISVAWRSLLERNDILGAANIDGNLDSGVFLRFELKGLAGVGTSNRSLLRQR